MTVRVANNGAKRWPWKCPDCDRTIIHTNLQNRHVVHPPEVAGYTTQHAISHLLEAGLVVTIETQTGRTRTLGLEVTE